MAGAERLVQAMRKIGKAATPSEDMTDLIYGVVIAVNPLRIQVESKFILEESQLLLSPFCTAEKITAANNPSISKDLNVWRGLQVADSVIMLRVNKGQTYYVLQRTGVLTP